MTTIAIEAQQFVDEINAEVDSILLEAEESYRRGNKEEHSNLLRCAQILSVLIIKFEMEFVYGRIA